MVEIVTDHLRAANYRRVSTVEQSTELHVSLAVQEEKFRQRVAERRYIASGEFTDIQSGRKDDRKEYQKLLALARSKQIDVIVVQRLDRFGRNPREILRRIWELQDLGVTIEATDEDLKSEIAMMLHAFMAGEESKRISARVIPTMERAYREGRWVAREPFGYVLDRDPTSPTRGHLTIDPGEAAIVRRIFALYLSGQHGFAAIARLLNGEGVASSMGTVWWAGAIRDLLMSPTYVGRPIWRNIPYPGGCPAIVDEDTWQAARDLQRNRTFTWHRQPPTSAFVLAGLVRCRCGRKRLCHIPDRRYPVRYYICPERNQGGACALRSIRAERLESFVLETVKGWELRLPQVVPTTDDKEDLCRSVARRAHLRASIERLQRRREVAYDQLMDQVITKDSYRIGEARYLGEIAALELELATLRELPPRRDLTMALAQVDRLRAALDVAPPAEVHLLLAELIESVQIESMTEWRVIPAPELAGLVSAPA